MKKVLFSLTLIALAAVLVFCAVATTGFVQKNLLYDDIKITLDGREIKPTDVNGNYIEPFIIDGTTYLPVRGIASTLGLDVDWDGETSTVMLNPPKKNDTTLLMERDGISVSYKNYEYDEDGNLVVKFFVENFSSNEVNVEAFDTSINGYILYNDLYENLPAGKKLNAEVIFYAEDLAENDIAYVESMEILFDVYDPYTFDSYMAPIIEITPDGATVTGEAELEYTPEQDYERDEKYQEYVDFVKENGTYNSELEAYEVEVEIPFDPETANGMEYLSLFLIYLEDADMLALEFVCGGVSNGMDVDYTLFIKLPGISDVYSWLFLMTVGENEIEMSGTWDATAEAFDAEGIEVLEITQGYEMLEDICKMMISMLTEALSLEGDVIFTEYGSDLTFDYFGI